MSWSGAARPRRRTYARLGAALAATAVWLGGLPAGGEAPLEWSEAARCVGRACAIRGTVVAQEDDGPVYRLYFDAQRRDVYVTLMRGWLVTWPDYTGRTIVATGHVDRFRDQVEMIVRTPDAIAFLDAPPTPAPPTAAPPTADALPATPVPATPVPTVAASEVERLRERVRSLEQRLEELERQDAPQEDRP